VNYTTAYTYNLAGEVVNMTYPSGRVVKHEYDAIGRVQHVKNNSTGATYAGSATYSAANQLTGFSYLNGISASFGYSADRLQLASVAYTQSSTNLLSLSYNYDQDSGSGVKNNGQIAGISDNVQSGRSATYTYDARKRLATAGTSGSTGYPQWGLSWTYDDYGNRTAQSVTAGSGPSNSVTVSTSTNRITAMGGYNFLYDSNGNLTQDDLYKYKYDAENRLVEVKNLSDTLIATYAFDGHSLRVIKVVGADRTWYLHAGTELIAEFEDAASATYSTPTNPGGAGSDSGALFLYQHGDHLTGRLTTDQQGNVSNEQGHYPYGEAWYATGTADPSVERKFTSYLKDAEVSTGRLNYAVFRQHSARVGRFLRPDPLLGRGAQGLNRYSYVRNNPVGRIDSRGLEDQDFHLGLPTDFTQGISGISGIDSGGDTRSGPDCQNNPMDPKCPPPLMDAASGAANDYAILFGGTTLGSWVIGDSGPAGGNLYSWFPNWYPTWPPGLSWFPLPPSNCTGPGTTRTTRRGPLLCNEGDTFIEEWECPVGCSRQECRTKASDYRVDVCHKRGEKYYASDSNFCSFTGCTTYAHCCRKEKP